MTRRRWIADEFSADHAALTGEHAAHLARTLRARVGQQFEVACGDTVRFATVTCVADDRVEFALGEELPAGAAVPITLLLAVFKFDRMEWAIEKCTELNVTTIVPVIARRTEKHLAAAAEKRAERWRRIAREASEQSRRAAPPEITAPMKLTDALADLSSADSKDALDLDNADARDARDLDNSDPKDALLQFAVANNKGVIPTEDVSPSGGTCCSPEGLKLVLAETERDLMLADVLRANDAAQSLTLAIGPEGGWTAEELQMFSTAQFIPCSLGETILRAETAAVAAVAIVRAERG